MKILLVDDSAQMRRMLRELLADFTAQLEECVDGAEAAAAYAEHQPDLVLMDILMPKVDGITAMRQILQANPTARVVILTNLDHEDFRRTALNAGACGYVLKDDLLNLRQRLLLIFSEEKPMPSQLLTIEEGKTQ